MYCTAEEIEAKRKRALEKLAQKQSPLKLVGNTSALQSPYTFKPWKSKPYEKPQEIKSPIVVQKVPVTAKLSLISADRFVVELSSFSNEAIAVIKTIQSRNYDSKTRKWDLHIDNYNTLVEKLGSVVNVERIPNFVINCVKRRQTDYSKIDLSKLDHELSSVLMPFQEDGVRFGISQNGKCLIADDMGLGKTFQALGIASYYREDWPVIIVTTTSIKQNWQQTILRYIPSVPIMQVQYMETGKDYINESTVLILSHDMMSRCLDKVMKKKFGVVIFDESHLIKNFKTKLSQAARNLAKKAKRVILLSGTPALSRPSELYTQLAMIDEQCFGTFFEYSKRYCDGQQGTFGWDSSGKSNLQELEIILKMRFMIRRTKGEVLKSLPNKVQAVVELNTNLSKLSQADRNCMKGFISKYEQQHKGVEKHAVLLSFFSETARLKIPSVCSYILQVLQSQKKFLVFAHHQKMLDAISELLQNKRVKFIRIDGSTSSEQRNNMVEQFQLEENCMVALLSITAANAGITLTAAQLVIFAELHWNPSILSQAESRAHRIGQVNSVVVKYLLARGTADDLIWPMLQEKQKILGEIGLSKDSFGDVTVVKQNMDSIKGVAEDLNFRSNRTEANTLDIASFFKNSDRDERSAIFGENAEENFHAAGSHLNSSFCEATKSENDEKGDTNVVEGVFDSSDVFNDSLDELLNSFEC